MNELYGIELNSPVQASGLGARARSIALRLGFAERRATALGVSVRECAAAIAPAGSARIYLRTDPAPSSLCIVFAGSTDAAIFRSLAPAHCDAVEVGDDEFEISLQLPDENFTPDREWLRSTQIWLAEQTPEELHHELLRTNEELRQLVDEILRQAEEEEKRNEALALANSRLTHMHELEYRRARIDPVSKLPSRVQFNDMIEELVEQATSGGNPFALLCLDLDFFKALNDSYGHAEGDRALLEVGKRMVARLRDSDTVARLGGDEFGILLRQLSDPRDAGPIAAMLIKAISEPLELEGGTGRLGASIGIAICPDDGADSETLLRHADAALYAVKRSGRGDYCFYRGQSLVDESGNARASH